MNMSQINLRRKANQIPFDIVNWLERLNPIVEHDDVGMMYKGCVLAEDIYGKYAAVIGTTDKLLNTPSKTAGTAGMYKVLAIQDVW